MKFGFAAPTYAYLLFLLPVIALVKILADRRAKKALESFASSSRLQANLLAGPSPIWAMLHFGLQILAAGFFIIALTRPQLGDDEKETEQSGRSIFIAIDTSKSMLAQDLTPSRLDRARLAAQDLLEKLSGDKVGIIAFAGRAFLQAPLTTDQEALVDTIQTIDHTTIPRGGSSLAAAIELALEVASKTRGVRHGLVIFTDGQETDEGTLAAAKRAAELDLIILPVGIGTPAWSDIPDPSPLNDGGSLRDEDGRLVKTRLESGLLKEVARITGGEYVELSSQPLTKSIVDRVMANLDRHQQGKRRLSRPIERYQWPLLAGIVCLIMSQLLRPPTRRAERTAPLPVDPQATVHPHPGQPPVPVAVAVRVLVLACALLLPLSAHAVVDPAVQTARDHYAAGRFDEARRAYSEMLQSKKPPASLDELYYGLAASELGLKEYDMAASSFSEALKSGSSAYQRQALRGLGTALYHQGEVFLKSFSIEDAIKSWTDSRDHYDSAIPLAPEGSEERTELEKNRAFVQERLDKLKKLDAKMKQQAKEAQEQRQKNKQKGEGKGKDDQSQEGDGEGEGQPQDADGQGDNQQQPSGGEDGGDDQKKPSKKTDALEKEKKEILEGQLRAEGSGTPGSQNPNPSDAANPDNMRNDHTGFTPLEARNQLKMYSDDKKGVMTNQHLMRRERAPGGKDY